MSADAVLHQLRTSRGKDVPRTMMGDHRAEVWVCDCWTGQLHAPAATFQLCLAHQVRNLQAVIELQTPESIWAAQVQAIFIDGKPLEPTSKQTRLYERYRERLKEVKEGKAPLGTGAN